MLSGVLRGCAAAKWSLSWGHFVRSLSSSSGEVGVSFRVVVQNGAGIPQNAEVGAILRRRFVQAAPEVRKAGGHSLVGDSSAGSRFLISVVARSGLGGGLQSGGLVDHSSSCSDMYLQAPSGGLSSPATLEILRTFSSSSNWVRSARLPLPPQAGASSAFHQTIRPPSVLLRQLSSANSYSPSAPLLCQRACGTFVPNQRPSGARSHYTRIFGDDGDQLVEPVEAPDLAPLPTKGIPPPLHSYPNAMMPFLASPPPLDAVVKIFTVTSSPNYFLPWQNKPQREVSGSGFVIAGQRILTNAHVVANQTFVLVRKHGTSTKYRAEVEAVGHECDLAVLKVPNEDFWEGMDPLEFGEIPQLQEQVAVVGYPQGGDNISVTAGVVSRVELTQYAHGAGLLLAVQIDAAINPGNSGGPAVMDFGSGGMNSNWKVVGVAFQNLREADSIGYIIPVPVIQHFLEDVEENGHYVGFCSLGLSCQQLENAQLRDHLGMRPGMTGVLVNRVQRLTDSHNHIRKDDVLMAFDGVPIANDGTVSFRKRERISFDHLVAMKKAGETAVVKVLREGKELELEVEVNPVKALIPIHQYDKLPSYFIFAGLVFVPLTQPYLHEYGDDWYNTSPRRLCERAMRSFPTQEGEQMVIISQVLIDDINSGYQTLAELQVKKVNGIEVRNLRHLRRLVEGCKEKFVRFDLDDERVMVLNFEEAKRASEGILSSHRIPSHISEDLEEDRFGDSEDVADTTWPDQVTEHQAIPVENRTNSKL